LVVSCWFFHSVATFLRLQPVGIPHIHFLFLACSGMEGLLYWYRMHLNVVGVLLRYFLSEAETLLPKYLLATGLKFAAAVTTHGILIS